MRADKKNRNTKSTNQNWTQFFMVANSKTFKWNSSHSKRSEEKRNSEPKWLEHKISIGNENKKKTHESNHIYYGQLVAESVTFRDQTF